MNKKKTISMISLAAIAVVAMVTVSPYFYDVTVDEPIPTAAAESAMTMDEMKKSFGQFVGSGDGIHDAKGDALVLSLDDGSRYLRFENFKSTNGPDLFVYLATDDKASDFVDLGRLTANNGNQNYEIPEGVDLSKYNKVLIWCKAFSVLFGSAELA